MKNAVQTSGQSITSIYYMPVILPRYMADKSDIPSEGQAEPQKVQDNNEASDERGHELRIPRSFCVRCDGVLIASPVHGAFALCKCGYWTLEWHPREGL